MPKKILIVASKFPPEYSGPGVRIMRLYNELKLRGKNYDLSVFCNGIEQNKNEIYQHEGIPVRRVTAATINKILRALSFLPDKVKSLTLYQAEFIKCLVILILHKEYKKTELIHLFGNSGGTAAVLLFARIHKIPVLMELVTALARPQQKVFGFFKITLYKKSQLITLTKLAETESINMGYPAEKIWCRANPINEKIFKIEHNNKLSYRENLSPFSKEDIVLVNVAKFMPQKNQLLIIEILKHLPENYKAVIAGPFIKDGPLYARDKKYIDNIKNKIEEYGLSKRVHLVFDFVDAHQYMKAGDLYLMPAWDEGFGTPMMEAMACGVPVIANKDEIAFKEWIENGENGYLCDINAPKDWASAIEKAVHITPVQKHQISEIIHKKAGQSAIYKQYESIIENLIKA